jgi:hypothetical protein
MGCDSFRTPDGGMAIICSRGRRAPSCQEPGCRQISTALCDFPTTRGKTCDRRMCQAHRTTVGPDRDYCAMHKDQQPLPEAP